MEEKTGWQGQSKNQIVGGERKEMVDLLVLPRPAKSVKNGAGFSRKT